MPKPKDLRISGVTFEDALRKVVSAPSPAKKQVKKAIKKASKNLHQN
jgi:hypothetical protein